MFILGWTKKEVKIRRPVMQKDSGGQTMSRACPEALSNTYASFLGRHFPREGSQDDAHKPSSLVPALRSLPIWVLFCRLFSHISDG